MPSHKYGLPLTPSGDSCRTSRLALRQIALVRPQAVVTSVAKEVARYNNLATNAQALNVNIAQHVLTRSKAEVLHLVELLIAKVREKCMPSISADSFSCAGATTCFIATQLCQPARSF